MLLSWLKNIKKQQHYLIYLPFNEAYSAVYECMILLTRLTLQSEAVCVCALGGRRQHVHQLMDAVTLYILYCQSSVTTPMEGHTGNAPVNE